MEQETTEKIFQEAQEAELKQERIKKIFILLFVSLIFGGTCYYYAGINNFQQKKLSKTEQLKMTINKEKKAAQLEKKPATLTTEAKKISHKTKFKPTDKSTLLSFAGKNSGKHDPFSYSESQFMPSTATRGENSSFPTNLPPVPGAGNMGTLPSLPGMSGFPSSGLASPPAPKPEDLIIVKGFIGNKVIAEIDGVVESLNVNEKISNVKVLTVNPETLTAKFEINGKPYIKTFKTLTDDYNGEVQLAKNLHY